MATTLVPRPCQEEAIRSVLLCVSKGYRRVVVKLPTGVGKTFTAALLARRVGRTLWLAHRQELIDQPIEAFSIVWPEADTGIVKGALDEYLAKDVVFASVQSEVRRLESRAGSSFDLIVVDEAHHAAAETYKKILRHYLIVNPEVVIVGLTATPQRADGKSIKGVFQAIAYKMSIEKAIQDDYLCPVRSDRIILPDLNLGGVKVNKQGDFSKAELADELLRAGVAKASAKTIHDKAHDLKTVVFTVSVDQAKRTAEELQALGIDAKWASGALSKRERKRRLKWFAKAKSGVLCCANLLLEGYDCPDISCVAMCRPTKSKIVWVQAVGRGLRKHPSKKFLLVLDLVGGMDHHGLVTAASLGKEKPESAPSDQEAQISSKGYICSQQCTAVSFAASNVIYIGNEVFCPRCGAPVYGEKGTDRELELLESFVKASREGISASYWEARKSIWVECREGLYAMSAGEHGTLVINEVAPSLWQVEQVTKSNGTYKLTNPSPLSFATTFAEDHAKSIGVLHMSTRAAGWRNKEATPGQIGALRKWGVNVTTRKWTKGDASDALTAAVMRAKYKRGAR